jgi:hypothetical protein
MGFKQKTERTVLKLRIVGYRSKAISLVIIMVFGLVAPICLMPQKANADSIIYEGIATNTASTASTTFAVNKPTGTINGDIMIANIAANDDLITITAPTGCGTWTTIATVSNSGSSAKETVRSFWKAVTGCEGSSFTFTGSTSQFWAGSISIYRGVDNSSAIAHTSATNSSVSATLTALDFTTFTTARTRIVGVFAAGFDGSTTLAPNSTNNTEIADMTTATGNNDIALEVTDRFYPQSTAPGANQVSTANHSATWGTFQFALKPDGVQHMILFWDGNGSTPPTGWSFVADAEGFYIRGNTPANYGLTGGQATHVHDNASSVSVGVPSIEIGNVLGLSNPGSPVGHAHTGVPSASVSGSAVTNEPANYTLRLIRNDTGIPNTIPANSIALFDDSGFPSDGHWTRLSAADGRVIKISNAAGVAVQSGSDTHTHTITWTGTMTADGTTTNTCLLCGAGSKAASASHTHAAPSASSSATETSIPPYVQSILAKVDQDTATISLGLTAMFDGDPGGGWVVRSNSGGSSYKRFIRPGSTYAESSNPSNLCDAGFGCDGHVIPNSTATSGAAVGAIAGNSSANTGAAGQNHTHVLTASWPAYTTDSHYTGNNEYFLPPYFNVVIAEKVNFIMKQYRWYIDPAGANNVTDPWGNPDLAENTILSVLPASNRAPGNATELRLRMNILVNNNTLAANTVSFRMQYKEGTDASCTTGTWTDVGAAGSGEIWRFTSQTTTADNATLSGVKLSLSTSAARQSYNRSNTGTNLNPNTASVGNYIEYDYHIVDNAATSARLYSFRLIENNGTLLSQYDVCPTLSTQPEAGDQLRHGNFFDNAGEKGFSWAD